MALLAICFACSIFIIVLLFRGALAPFTAGRGSNDLKKGSLEYPEGLFQMEGSSRVRAAVIGGTGPDLVLGRATARASHQSVLSSQLSPPAKWSYLKIGSWAVLVFLCVGWLIFYINTVKTNSTTVLSASVA